MKAEMKADLKAYTFYLLCAGLIALIAMSGCAPLKRLVNDHEFAMQLSVEAATARILHEYPSWTQQTVAITDIAIKAINEKAVIDLQSVEVYVKGHIHWDRLEPEEQTLVSALISEVRRSIEDSLRAKGIISPELQLIEVRQVLVWINEVAKR